MKKLLPVILSVFLFVGCKVYQDPHLPQASLSAEEKAFVAQFEDAVVKHKRSVLATYLYPAYKSEQLDDMYGGDAKAFWNQFFCGKQIDNPDKFTCIKLKNVREIHILQVTSTQNPTEKELTFEIVGYDVKIRVSLILKRYTDTSGKTAYGIIGAYG